MRVVAGTDAGGYEHGINAREIVLLEQAGLTPMQAIQAATGWAAECLGLGSEIGTVEPGKLADMIAVSGNPLEDIAVLEDHQRIALVIKGGTVHVDRGERHPDQAPYPRRPASRWKHAVRRRRHDLAIAWARCAPDSKLSLPVGPRPSRGVSNARGILAFLRLNSYNNR